MKISLHLERVLGVVCLAGLLGLGAGGARGQDALEITNGKFTYDGKERPATMANIADAVREMYPGSNFALAPGVQKLTIEDLKLRTPRVDEVLEALRVASGNQFTWRYGRSEAIDPATGLPANSADNSLIVLEPDRATSQEEAPRRMVEVFNLRPFLQQLSTTKPDDKEVAKTLEELRSIIERTSTVLSEGKSRDRAMYEYDFQYHPGARLLVVVGSPELVEVARKVINAVNGTAVPGGYGVAPAGAGTDSETMDAFRRRYGLGPVHRAPAPAPSPGGESPSAPAPGTPAPPR